MKKLYIAVVLTVIFTSLLYFIIFHVIMERFMTIKAYAYEWNFDVEKSALGWIATHGFSEFQLTEEGLMAVVIGFDPYIHSPRVNIVAEKQFKVIVLAKIIGNASMLKLYWVSSRSPNWDEEKILSIFVKANGEWHEYVFDMSEHPHWSGIITGLRLDLEPADCYATKIFIRCIKVPLLGAEIKVRGPYFSTPIPSVNKEFKMKIKATNLGGEALNLNLELRTDAKLQVLGENRVVTRVDARSSADISWSLVSSHSGLHRIELSISSDKTETFTYIIKFPIYPEINLKDEAFRNASEGVTSLPDGSYVLRARDTLVYFPKSSIGYGPIIVSVKSRESRITGVFGCFAQVTLVGKKELKERILIVPSRVCSYDNESIITFIYDDDERLLFSSTWMVENQSVKVRSQMKALENIYVSQFATSYHPGELGFASSKDEALFPGLEWLVGDEKSSNTLDVKRPHNLRNAPHPLKITIPLMALRYSNIVTGVLLDPYAAWDDEGNYPQSLQFASPNWIEEQNNHLFMVFVPTVPEWVRENDDEAYKPYCLESGKKLSLNFNIYSGISYTILEAVLEWVRLFGLPDPVMPRTLNEELKLSMEAYLKSLWVPQEGWRHASGWTPKPYPGYALLLLLTGLVIEDPSLEAELNERFNEAIKLALNKHGSSFLASGDGCHIPGWQLPFYIGYLEDGLNSIKRYIDSLILSQEADGEWSFQPDERTRILGRAGSREVGLTATFAAEVLRWARMTGDADAFFSGLKALRAMERYTVPRGAQTWEIPIHTPDILASAKALEAYLEAYIYSGEQKYLEKAKYWAYTGLPFIYLWARKDRYTMLYASIPVFGATFYTWPWFGKPVQWCGLVYAYQLLRLSKYDDSFPWRKIGEGILSSGMRQQISSGSLTGTFPDSWDLITDNANGPYINPEDLVKPTLFLMGFDPDLNTLVLRSKSRNIVITTPANILGAAFNDEDGVLEINLSYLRGRSLYVLISGFQAKLVKSETKILFEAEGLNELDEGWKNTLNKFVIVKLIFREEKITLILLEK